MDGLNITISDLSLDTIIGQDYDGGPLTLADALVVEACKQLAHLSDYRSVQERIRELRTEVIRERVTAEVEAALTAETTPTNEFGEPSAPPTTLRALIAKMAKEAIAPRKANSYGEKTAIEKVVKDEVDRAIAKELAAAVADEKAKLVAVIRAKTADLLTQAVKDGLR
jgi:hypothetical protein